MGNINVRLNKTQDLIDTIKSFNVKRKKIIEQRKKTSIDTDTINNKLKSVISDYVKDEFKGKKFDVYIEVSDKTTSFKLLLNNHTSIETAIVNNIFTLEPSNTLSIVKQNINYLIKLRKELDIDSCGIPNPLEFIENENEKPNINIEIKTRTKYF